MNADEIRAHSVKEIASFSSMNCRMLIELTAQIAEANHQFGVFRRELGEELKRIANPHVVNSQSPWVTMTYNGRKYLVNKESVAMVERCNDTKCIITMHTEGGENSGRWCDGTMKEVCSKLGIPVDGL